jgi:FixJ family two-component response regulator
MNKTLSPAVGHDAALRITSLRLFESGRCTTQQYGYGAALLGGIIALEGRSIVSEVNLPVRGSAAVRQAFPDKIDGMPVLPMTGSGDLSSSAALAVAAERRQAPACGDEALPRRDPFCLRLRRYA